ncbi:MAG: N-acetyltransferase [Acidimicrobiales bacterium]|nr:N-acetyltransferase [Acidimicrobiales bacterium]
MPLRSGRCDRPGEVSLVVVATDDAELRTATLALAPRLDQERFSGRARETLPWADRVTTMTPFAVVADGAPVGFGILDTTELHLLALTPRPDRAVLLRSFYVDAAHQGRGIGRRAAAEIGILARDVAAQATEVVLTVDEHNPIAAHTYRAAGFVDDGDRYLGGTLGPQHILRLPLPPRPN